jgi:hypothetical protein
MHYRVNIFSPFIQFSNLTKRLVAGFSTGWDGFVAKSSKKGAVVDRVDLR